MIAISMMHSQQKACSVTLNEVKVSQINSEYKMLRCAQHDKVSFLQLLLIPSTYNASFPVDKKVNNG
jgi:hypothetical protein